MSFGIFDCCGKRSEDSAQRRAAVHYSPREEPPKAKFEESVYAEVTDKHTWEQCGVGIVFASDGSGGLVVKGFVPRSTAARSGAIQEGDLLVQVDKTEVHRWPVAEIAPLMLGPPGSTVMLGFRRKVAGGDGSMRLDSLNSQEGSVNGPGDPDGKPRVPKLWQKGATPRNEFATNDSGGHYAFFEVALVRGQVPAQ